MTQTIVVGLASLLFVVFLPATLVPSAEDMRAVTVYVESSDVLTEEKIVLQTEDEVLSIPLEEYLVGVVLAEMPASFSDEALKAQAVAARTVALRSMEHGKHSNANLCSRGACCQAWTALSEVKEKLGNTWEQYVKKVSAAVYSTRDQVLLYNDCLIEALYFSCSGGMTESAVDVWGNEVPYLKSVESKGEEGASKYSQELTVSLEDFWAKISKENPNVAQLSSGLELYTDVIYTEGGGVSRMKIGGVWFDGITLRNIFDLNSTRFTTTIKNGMVTFRVFGYGHRVGMSQYGANAMAEAGYSYEEILRHYYPGTEIDKKSGSR